MTDKPAGPKSGPVAPPASTMALPDWITPVDGNPAAFRIDRDLAYPMALADLGFDAPVDQYTLEIAHNFIKLDAQVRIGMAGLDPRKADPPFVLALHIKGDAPSKERWGQKNHPPGRYAEIRERHAANPAHEADPAAGRMAADREVAMAAREHYKRVRGYLPA